MENVGSAPQVQPTLSFENTFKRLVDSVDLNNIQGSWGGFKVRDETTRINALGNELELSNTVAAVTLFVFAALTFLVVGTCLKRCFFSKNASSNASRVAQEAQKNMVDQKKTKKA